jgi:hypothetical protein
MPPCGNGCRRFSGVADIPVVLSHKSVNVYQKYQIAMGIFADIHSHTSTRVDGSRAQHEVNIGFLMKIKHIHAG